MITPKKVLMYTLLKLSFTVWPGSAESEQSNVSDQVPLTPIQQAELSSCVQQVIKRQKTWF